MNVGPDHLSRIENGKEPSNIDEGLLDTQLFAFRVVDKNFVDIFRFLPTNVAPKGYTTQQKKELVVRAANFSVIVGNLYKMRLNEVIHRYVPEYERQSILDEAHGGVAGGHYAGKATL